MKKICFYCANYEYEEFSFEPLGIGYLASYLIEKKYCNESDILIVNNIDDAIKFKPDIVGISAVSHVFQDAINFAKTCKESFDCITIIGGYHISTSPYSLPLEFDIGVIGEGEETLADIVNLTQDGDINSKLSLIKGICFHKNNKIQKNQERELIHDINDLPFPLRTEKGAKIIGIFTSRGCPYKCTFCASQLFWNCTSRFRSADSVINEILHILSTHEPSDGILTIKILDDLWLANKKRFKEIVDKILEYKIHQKVEFTGFCRSNIIKEDDIKLLIKMNFKVIRFGAETGSDNLLKKIKGNSISISDHQRVIDLCEKYNIPCTASFMFGIPGETKDDLQETKKFLRKNKNKLKISGFYYCNPIPGTEIWDNLIKNKQITSDFDFASLPLDFLSNSFNWDNIVYFNKENVELDYFKKYILSIRIEFMLLVTILVYMKKIKLKFKKILN